MSGTFFASAPSTNQVHEAGTHTHPPTNETSCAHHRALGWWASSRITRTHALHSAQAVVRQMRRKKRKAAPLLEKQSTASWHKYMKKGGKGARQATKKSKRNPLDAL